MHRVLVVGEGGAEEKALAYRLNSTGVEVATSGVELDVALHAAFEATPDVIVLLCETGDEWQQLFRLLSRVCGVPVVVVGGGGEADMLWYLNEGAADYLAKPVSALHLSARLGAVLRRTGHRGGEFIRIQDLEIDMGRYEVRRQGRAISLTRTEFRLLHALAERKGQVCAHRMLVEKVWGEDFSQCTHYLRLYIGYLRQKLEDDPRSPTMLVTERGVGYRLVDRPPWQGLSAGRELRVAQA